MSRGQCRRKIQECNAKFQQMVVTFKNYLHNWNVGMETDKKGNKHGNLGDMCLQVLKT